MNHQTLRRKWASVLLLAVFIPMLILSSMHQHHEVASAQIDCQECLHHVHHDGHIASATVTIDHCLLCQFLSLPFIAAATLVFCRISQVFHQLRVLAESYRLLAFAGIHPSRAPPFVLFA